MSRLRLAAVALTALALLPDPSEAIQNIVLDEGVFVVTVDGRDVGRESFKIQLLGSGPDATIHSSAVVEYDDGTDVLRSNLRQGVTAEGMPRIYQHEVTGGDNASVRVRPGDRRFIAEIRTDAGERERQLRQLPGVVLIEGRLAHQYYFLPKGLTVAQAVPVIVPRSGILTSLSVTSTGSDPVTIGRTSVDATRVEFVIDDQVRRIWLDLEGRVLRLEIPDLALNAVRESI